MPAGCKLHHSASATCGEWQVDSLKHPIQRYSSGASTHTLNRANPMLHAKKYGQDSLKLMRPEPSTAALLRSRDLQKGQPREGNTPCAGQQASAVVDPASSVAQHRASVVKAFLSPESEAGQFEGEPSSLLALACAHQAGRRMSGGRHVDDRGRMSFTGSRQQRKSLQKSKRKLGVTTRR